MKKILKFFSFVLLMVLSITLMSCDDKNKETPDNGTNDSAGGNTGGNTGDSGNTGGNTGGQAHEHSVAASYTYDGTQHWKVCSGCDEKQELANHTYGEWETVIEPLLFVKGYKEKECVCGHIISEDIAATGSELTADSYTAKLMESLGNKFGITVSDISFVYADEYYNYSLTSNDIKLYVEIEEDGILYAYGTGDIEIEEDGIIIEYPLQVVVKDDYIYFIHEYNGATIGDVSNIDYSYYDNSSLFMKISLSDFLEQNQDLEADMIDISSILAVFEEEVVAITDVLANVDYNVLNVCVNLLAKNLMDVVLTKTEGTNDITYSVNYEALYDLNEKLDTMTIEELYNEANGDGAYAALSTMVAEVFDATIGDLYICLEETDLDLKAIIDFVDKILVNFVDPEASVKSYFEGLTNEDIEDIVAYLNQAGFRETKIVDFIKNTYQLDLSAYEEMISQILATYKDLTVYELIALFMMGDEEEEAEPNLTPEQVNAEEEIEYSVFKQMVDSFIQLAVMTENSTFTTDKEGNITDISINLDFAGFEMFGFAGGVTAKVELNPNYVFDDSTIINRVNEVYNAIVINKDTQIYSEYDNELTDYSFKYDNDGKLTGYFEEKINVNFEWNGDSYNVYVTYETTTYDLTELEIAQIYPYCDGLYYVILANPGICQGYTKMYNVVIDGSIFSQFEGYPELNYSIYNLVKDNTDFLVIEEYLNEAYLLEFVYDATDNALYVDNFNDGHNCVKDEEKSSEAISCGDVDIDYYVCSDCDYVYIEIQKTTHEDHGEINYEISETENCENGVTYTYTCSACNESWDEEINQHIYFMDDLLEQAGVEKAEYHCISLQKCPCMESYEFMGYNLVGFYRNFDEDDNLIYESEDYSFIVTIKIYDGETLICVYEESIADENLKASVTFNREIYL